MNIRKKGYRDSKFNKSQQSAMRTFKEIAMEIRQKWANISPYAYPYLDAMLDIDSTDKNAPYYYDSAKSVVLYFLANAQGFRGNDARRIKAELRRMIK